MNKNESTETRIKDAAKKLFQMKGYGLTRTREIAESAGINSALLNYYFRSKENLFHIIMIESMRDMFSFLASIINEPETSLSYKIDAAVIRYIDLCENNPHLPLFIMNQLHADSEKIIRESGIPKDLLTKSVAIKQLQEHLVKNNIDISPIHFFINIISLSVIPTLAYPILNHLYDIDKNNIGTFWEERKKWIPVWIRQTLKIDE